MRRAVTLVLVLGSMVALPCGGEDGVLGDEYELELEVASAAAPHTSAGIREPAMGRVLPPWAEAYYFADFEADNGGLVGSGDWEWGVYAWSPGATYCDISHLELPPLAAHSGSSMWGTTLNDCYSGLGGNADFEACVNLSLSDDSTLVLTPDLRSVTTAWLSWAEWFDIVVFFDWVEIRVNGTVVEQRCGSEWDNSNRDQWRLKEIDLTPWAGTEPVVAFHMMASPFLNYSGWYLDDLAVTDLPVVSGLFFDGFEGGTTDGWSSATP